VRKTTAVEQPGAATLGAIFGGSSVATFLGLPPATIVDGAKANIALFGAATATPYPAAGAYFAGAIRPGSA
jgi:hypothetical protein